MNYCSYEFATAQIDLNVFETKIILKIVQELQKYLKHEIAPDKKTKVHQPPELVFKLNRKKFINDVVKDSRHFRRTMEYIKDIHVVTSKGRTVRIFNEIKFLYKTMYIDLSIDFFNLVFNFKTGVCYFPNSIFKLKNFYAIKLLCILYGRERFHPQIKQLRFILNNEKKNKDNRVFVLRTLKEPQEHYYKIGLEGFYHTVNYTQSTYHNRKIISIDFISRFSNFKA